MALVKVILLIVMADHSGLDPSLPPGVLSYMMTHLQPPLAPAPCVPSSVAAARVCEVDAGVVCCGVRDDARGVALLEPSVVICAWGTEDCAGDDAA